MQQTVGAMWSSETEGHCTHAVIAISTRGLLEGIRDHLVFHHAALVHAALTDRFTTPEHRAIRELWARVGDE